MAVFTNDELELTFFLPSGCYATVVMRELAIIADVTQRNYHESKIVTDNKSTKAHGI